jgi:hypothetical protein
VWSASKESDIESEKNLKVFLPISKDKKSVYSYYAAPWFLRQIDIDELNVKANIQ